MESLINDLRIGLRSLRQRPGFFGVAVITLALGIGASTAIFAVVEATLLRPLPFPEPDELAMVWGVAGPDQAIRGGSPIEVADWHTLTHSFTDVSIYDRLMMNLSGAGDARQVNAERVSPSYFTLLGAAPAFGRSLTADDDRVGAPGVAVISDGLWRAQFGADRNVIGKSIELDDQAFTIVGVMPAGFGGLASTADIWTSVMPFLTADAAVARGNRWVGALARTKPGVTQVAAQLDLDAAAKRLAEQFPESNRDRGALMIPLRDASLGSMRGILTVVFGGVGLLLLIACANVANLQLVRTSGRLRELSLRHALGASRVRIIRQLMTESVLLSLIGGGVGVFAAAFALSGLLPLIPVGLLPAYATISLNPIVIAFALGVAIVAGALLGVVPALRTNATSAASLTGSRTTSAGWRRGTVSLQQLIIGGEVAVSLVLLAAAGLALRSFQAQLAIEPGFDATNVLGASVNLSSDYDRSARTVYTDQMLEQLRALPGVTAAAIASDAPLRNTGSSAALLRREGFPDDAIRYYRHRVTPDYFATLGIPLIAGRLFTPQDRPGAPTVAVVSKAFATKLWPAADALGKRVFINNEWVPIVGVVGDVHYRDLTTDLMDPSNDPDIYLSYAQLSSSGPIDILLKTTTDPAAMTASVRDIVRRADASLALYNVDALENTLRTQTGIGRLTSLLLSLFGVLSLLLAAVGLYGVMSFIVRGRRREIAIRSAIGASPTDIRTLVLGQGMRVVVIGIVIGGIGTTAAGKLLAGMLYGVSAIDPLVLFVTTTALLAAAFVANWIPARQAVRVAPQTAMAPE